MSCSHVCQIIIFGLFNIYSYTNILLRVYFIHTRTFRYYILIHFEMHFLFSCYYMSIYKYIFRINELIQRGSPRVIFTSSLYPVFFLDIRNIIVLWYYALYMYIYFTRHIHQWTTR